MLARSADGLLLRWTGAPPGSRHRVYLGTKPDAFDLSAAPLAEVEATADGVAALLGAIPDRPRPYLALVDAESGARRVVAQRLLPLEGSHNTRDLGGHPTADGRRVRWGMLYRSDHLGDLSDEDVAYLRDLGIRLVCDFRGEAERAGHPDRLPDDPAPAVEWLPIADPSFDPEAIRQRILSGEATAEEMSRLLVEGNRLFATRYRDRYRRLFERLQAPDGLPALIHCTAGKDRAGFGSALILRVLGVPEDVVFADFMLTNTLTREHVWRMLLLIRVGSLFRTDPEAVRPLLGVRREYLQAAFDAIDGEYGSFDAYVREALGLSDAARAALRDRLLE